MEKNQFPYEVYDEEKVACALRHLPCETHIESLSTFYKIMGDPTRLMLLMALEAGELCASDLANVTNMSRSAVSHQLKTLRQAKLVKSRRDGKIIFYELDDEHIHSVLKVALEHIKEDRHDPQS
ncbi:metalloregulator ArsR/SmtB family transcription factor [uncultured Dubosiella sp.]|uniref:ArsR/SmtB family transcription factor n=1 Tax=uncultured Dubosiella sp. TaxID=1937011 RepID=UPI00259B18B6|nr:metalloregulator ArsR/SmtB family transcription factor [uncultured Dubosiella sp.]